MAEGQNLYSRFGGSFLYKPMQNRKRVHIYSIWEPNTK